MADIYSIEIVKIHVISLSLLFIIFRHKHYKVRKHTNTPTYSDGYWITFDLIWLNLVDNLSNKLRQEERSY